MHTFFLGRFKSLTILTKRRALLRTHTHAHTRTRTRTHTLHTHTQRERERTWVFFLSFSFLENEARSRENKRAMRDAKVRLECVRLGKHARPEARVVEKTREDLALCKARVVERCQSKAETFEEMCVPASSGERAIE